MWQDLGVLMRYKLNMSQQYTAPVKKANAISSCISKSIESMTCEAKVLPYAALVKPQVWVQQFRKSIYQ